MFSRKVENPEELAPIDRLPVVGYQGFRPVYRNPVKRYKEPTKEELATLKQLEEFEALPEEAKRTVLENEYKNLVIFITFEKRLTLINFRWNLQKYLLSVIQDLLRDKKQKICMARASKMLPL